MEPIDTTPAAKLPLSDMTPEEMAEALALKPFQGRQIFQWIHQHQVFDFGQMTNLSKELRARLAETCTASRVALVERAESPDSGTAKTLLRLEDGETVESVLIRDDDRLTLCLSSQVGCPLKCAFCATGLAGFTRNLTPGEIVEQALYLLSGEDLAGRTPNIVYMGMGEPFRNYDAVMRSVRMLMSPEGLNIGARKITISTAGEVGGIERFTEEATQVRLSVSLHAANDALRSKLVPLNRRYPLEALRAAIEHYITTTNRQMTFEWTLLADVNDTYEHACELIAFIGDLKAFVNLIPWNPVEGIAYAPTDPKRAKEFCDTLCAAGVKATLRQEKGQDIRAACGQLRRTHGA